MRYVWISLVVSILLSPVGCRRDKEQKKPDGRRAAVVFTSIEPLAYFVQRIAGDEVTLEVLVGPGQDPHSYDPLPKQMVSLANAKLLFHAGMGFEDAIAAKLTGAGATTKIVDVSRGIEILPLSAGADEHNGRHDHDHEHDIDPHVWMSPKAAKVISQTICDELCAALPEAKDQFRKNLQTLLGDLDRLDAKLAATLAPLKGKTFYVYHPAFGHFARAYGLKQQAVETGGKAPGPRRLKQLMDSAEADGVKVIFVQRQFSRLSAKTIAEQIGATVIPLDPLARDYISNMESIADKLAAGREGK